MTLPQKLTAQGFRLTTQRKAILQVMKDFPQTVQEVHSALIQKKIQVDLASVYRSLELFINLGLVYAIELGEGKKRYELVNDKNHHHHLVCNSCGTIKDIKVDEQHFLKAVSKESNFMVDHHHLEFFGLCASCQ